MHWKPNRELSVLRLGLALITAALSVCVILIAVERANTGARALERIASVPHASLRAPIRGRAEYTGTLIGPAGRLSAMNFPSAAYAGWVMETTGSGKNQTVRRVCNETGEIGGLSIHGDDRTIPLQIFQSLRYAQLLEGDLNPDAHRAVLDLGEATNFAALPSGLMESCGLRTHRGTMNYFEMSAAPGAPVTVIACFDGAALVECPGGDEVVAVGGLHRVGDSWATWALFPVRVFATIMLLALVALAGFTIGKAVRLDRAARSSV